MNYRMNDASFKAPEGWFDQTLYILSSEVPGKPGISLVIHSEELDSKKDSTAYKELSVGRFPLELPGFKLLHEKEIAILNNTKAWILEHTWIADTGLMHHYQAVCSYA